MTSTLRALILEDRPEDVDMMVRVLHKAGYTLELRVARNQHEFEQQVRRPCDVILADYLLPGFDARKALKIVQLERLDVPVIIVSGQIGDEQAVECLHEGAADFVLKDRMARLGMAVKRALDLRDARLAERAAQEALARMSIQRPLVRKIIGDLIEQARIDRGALSMVGRRLAESTPAKDLEEHARAFTAMGLGKLHIVEEGDRRAIVEGLDLLEVAPGSRLVTCAFASGYVAGALSSVRGRPAKGDETMCQSRGDAVCRFIAQVQ